MPFKAWLFLEHPKHERSAKPRPLGRGAHRAFDVGEPEKTPPLQESSILDSHQGLLVLESLRTSFL